MTHVDDLYEPNDREPTEPDDDEREPVDLDEIERLMTQRHAELVDDQREAVRLLLDEMVPQMADEIVRLRDELARWKALPTREEYTVSVGQPGAASSAPESLRERLADLADGTGQALYARTLHFGPWRRLDKDAPF